MMSIDGSLTTELASVVTFDAGTWSRLVEIFRTATLVSSRVAPERAAKSPESSCNKRATLEPTTPQPSMPILKVFALLIINLQG